MISERFRLEVMGIVEKFNQSEFNQDDSYYFVRFYCDFVYIDLCSNGRIELFSRFQMNKGENDLTIEVLGENNAWLQKFKTNSADINFLQNPLKRLMKYGLLSQFSNK